MHTCTSVSTGASKQPEVCVPLSGIQNGQLQDPDYLLPTTLWRELTSSRLHHVLSQDQPYVHDFMNDGDCAVLPCIKLFRSEQSMMNDQELLKLVLADLTIDTDDAEDESAPISGSTYTSSVGNAVNPDLALQQWADEEKQAARGCARRAAEQRRRLELNPPFCEMSPVDQKALATAQQQSHVHMNVCNYDAALQALTEGLAITRRVGARHNEAHLLGMIGSVFETREEHETAIQFFHQSLEIAVHVGNAEIQNLTTTSIRRVQRQMRKQVEAPAGKTAPTYARPSVSSATVSSLFEGVDGRDEQRLDSTKGNKRRDHCAG